MKAHHGGDPAVDWPVRGCGRRTAAAWSPLGSGPCVKAELTKAVDPVLFSRLVGPPKSPRSSLTERREGWSPALRPDVVMWRCVGGSAPDPSHGTGSVVFALLWGRWLHSLVSLLTRTFCYPYLAALAAPARASACCLRRFRMFSFCDAYNTGPAPKSGTAREKEPVLAVRDIFIFSFFSFLFLDFFFRKILSRTVLAKWVWWDWECARIPWGVGIAGGLYLTSEALCFDLNAGLSFKLPQRSRSCDQAVGWCYLSARLWVLRDAQILAIPHGGKRQYPYFTSSVDVF